MRTRLVGSLAIVAVTAAACGSGGKQGEVADLMLEEADRQNIELDEGCVEDVAGKLSDDDADKLVEAGVDGDADISPEAEALANEMFACLDTDTLVDQIVAEMGDENVDVDCLKEAFRGIDAANFEDDPAFAAAMLDCVELGG